MIQRFALSAIILASLIGGPAAAQQDLSHMSCADYLKLEHWSDWTQGVTGKPAVNKQSTRTEVRMHDYCKQNPQANAADVDRAMKQGK